MNSEPENHNEVEPNFNLNRSFGDSAQAGQTIPEGPSGPIRILILEDVEDDVELMKIEMENAGLNFMPKWVDNKKAFLRELESFSPDIILSDYAMPNFSGMQALALVVERYPSIPFIIVTGAVSEEVAVHCLMSGAWDYLLKNNIKRLGPAIENALEKKRISAEIEQAHKMIRRSIREWESTYNAMSDWVSLLDLEGRILRSNNASEIFLRMPRQKILGRICCELVHGQDFPIPNCPMQKMIQTRQPESSELYLSGKNQWWMITVDPVFDMDGSLVSAVHVVRDITDRVLAEKRFKDAQSHIIEVEKLGALGTLTAGIAHELNNPLMGMINYSQYCLKHVPESNKAFSVLGDMVRETKRCIDIVKNLLTFSRMEEASEENLEKIHCSIIIDRVMNLLKYRIEKENISIKRSGEDDLPEIFAKTSNLQQVFLNLIGNALDALSGEKDKVMQIRAFNETDTIRFEITDNGCGIIKEQLAKIFDPFFTTKPVGKGTGLGLSVCRGIVEAHNGKISCDSKPGQGTTFRVVLPIRPSA